MKLLLKETIMFFVENIGELLKIALPIIIIISIADFYSAPINGYSTVLRFGLWFVSTALFCLLSSSLIIFLSQAIYNQPIAPKDCIWGGIVYVPYILFVNMIIVCPYLGFLWLVKYFNQAMMSSFLLVVVSIFMVYFGLKTSFTSYFIVLEENKPIQAIINSFHYTDGFVLKIVFAILCLGVPLSLAKLSYWIIVKNMTVLKPLLNIGGDIFFSFISVVIQVVVFKIFCLSFVNQDQKSNMA